MQQQEIQQPKLMKFLVEVDPQGQIVTAVPYPTPFMSQAIFVLVIGVIVLSVGWFINSRIKKGGSFDSSVGL